MSGAEILRICLEVCQILRHLEMMPKLRQLMLSRCLGGRDGPSWRII